MITPSEPSAVIETVTCTRDPKLFGRFLCTAEGRLMRLPPPEREGVLREEVAFTEGPFVFRIEPGRRILTYRHPKYGRVAVIEGFPAFIHRRFTVTGVEFVVRSDDRIVAVAKQVPRSLYEALKSKTP